MKIVALVALLSFMIVSLVVGLRLAGLYRRTRALPEALLSFALLGVGFLSFSVATAAKIFFDADESLRRVLVLAGLGIECLGVLALAAFAWRVFHPERRAAAAAFVVVAMLIVGTLVGEIASGQYLRYSDAVPIAGPWVPLGLAARSLGPASMALSCARYHAQLRRRARLGLAEPLIVHRVALWGLGIGASALAYWTGVIHRLMYGTGLKEHDAALAIAAVFATVTAISLGLAYFPPRRYRAWVDGDAASPPKTER